MYRSPLRFRTARGLNTFRSSIRSPRREWSSTTGTPFHRPRRYWASTGFLRRSNAARSRVRPSIADDKRNHAMLTRSALTIRLHPDDDVVIARTQLVGGTTVMDEN